MTTQKSIPVEALPIGTVVEYTHPGTMETKSGIIMRIRKDFFGNYRANIQKLFPPETASHYIEIDISHIDRVVSMGLGHFYDGRKVAYLQNASNGKYQDGAPFFKSGHLSKRGYDHSYAWKAFANNVVQLYLPNYHTVSKAFYFDLAKWLNFDCLTLHSPYTGPVTSIKTKRIKRWIKQNVNRYLIKTDSGFTETESLITRMSIDDNQCGFSTADFGYSFDHQLTVASSLFNKNVNYRGILYPAEVHELAKKKNRLYRHSIRFSNYHFDNKPIAIEWFSDCPTWCIPTGVLESLPGWKSNMVEYGVFGGFKVENIPNQYRCKSSEPYQQWSIHVLQPEFDFALFFIDPLKLFDRAFDGKAVKI